MSNESREPTINSVGDFARHLGLSRWTVSRILNGHDGVHEDTLKRVREEMKRLNFQPNMMARTLRGAKTGLVGVCLQGMSSPILAKKISCIQESLHGRGLRGVLEVTSGDADAERDVINHFLSLRVDSIILVGSVLEAGDSVFERMRSTKVSAVAIDPAHNIPIARVEVDRRMGMELCLRHLKAKRHERIGLLGLESDPVYGVKRMEGLREAAKTAGFVWDEVFVSMSLPGWAKWSFEYGYALAQELLQQAEPPRGIIALNDEVAVGAIKAIKEWGYAVPEDFSVIGFDNLDIGKWTDPPLSSIAQNVEELVAESIGLLGANSNQRGEVRMVAPRMIVRGSS
ncbi:MAG: LacI family DNA-binding transcriptional regulator [Verrucomicrobiota bacterium]